MTGGGWEADLLRGLVALAVFGAGFWSARRRFQERGSGEAADNGLD